MNYDLPDICTSAIQDLKDIRIILEQQEAEARKDILHPKWQYMLMLRSLNPVLQKEFGSRLRYRFRCK